MSFSEMNLAVILLTEEDYQYISQLSAQFSEIWFCVVFQVNISVTEKTL